MSALLLVLMLLASGGTGSDSLRSTPPTPKTLPPVTVKIDTTNRLARAIERLKGEKPKSPKSGFRTIHLLGGKLSARIPQSP
jgi:hypothetical protein